MNKDELINEGAPIEAEPKVYVKSPPMIKVGNKFRVQITSMTHDAKGIAKVSGVSLEGDEITNFPIFTPGILIEEGGIVEIVKMKKSYAEGQILKLFPDMVSPNRVTPPCEIYEECGGCQLMHMSYDMQLNFKKSMLRQTLQRIGGLENLRINNVIGMDNPNQYRNKVQVPFGVVRGKLVCGFYKLGTHEIIPMTSCTIQSTEMSEIVKFVRNLCGEYGIKGYDETIDKGDIRHVLIRESSLTKEHMVVLVCTKDNYPYLDELVNKLVLRHPTVTSVIINVNKGVNNTILGKYCKVIYGKRTITDEINGLKFEIGAKSFFQVNHQQTEKLYQKVVELGEFKSTDIVIDAYCGIGTIGSFIAPAVKKVYGVEIVDDAINNAKSNAEINGINNIEFVCAKAEEQIAKWQADGIKADVIVVDPPRKGLDESLLTTIVEMNIPKVIYVSCDPATLARDLKYLTTNGYEINTIQPVDMFPQTVHVETVVLMSRK